MRQFIERVMFACCIFYVRIVSEEMSHWADKCIVRYT